MTKIVDFSQGKERLSHQRKDEKAQALRERLAASREDAARNDPGRRAAATRRLLDLFKHPPSGKR